MYDVGISPEVDGDAPHVSQSRNRPEAWEGFVLRAGESNTRQISPDPRQFLLNTDQGGPDRQQPSTSVTRTSCCEGCHRCHGTRYTSRSRPLCGTSTHSSTRVCWSSLAGRTRCVGLYCKGNSHCGRLQSAPWITTQSLMRPGWAASLGEPAGSTFAHAFRMIWVVADCESQNDWSGLRVLLTHWVPCTTSAISIPLMSFVMRVRRCTPVGMLRSSNRGTSRAKAASL